MSYKLKISPKERVSGRFLAQVRKALISTALSEGASQQSIATKLDVNRSVINRLLRGDKNLTIRSIGELAWALDYKPTFSLEKKKKLDKANYFNEDAEQKVRIIEPNSIHLHTQPSMKVSSFAYEFEDA